MVFSNVKTSQYMSHSDKNGVYFLYTECVYDSALLLLICLTLHKSTMLKIKHYMRHENKVNKNE